jgi:hypothetical protein
LDVTVVSESSMECQLVTKPTSKTTPPSLQCRAEGPIMELAG